MGKSSDDDRNEVRQEDNRVWSNRTVDVEDNSTTQTNIAGNTSGTGGRDTTVVNVTSDPEVVKTATVAAVKSAEIAAEASKTAVKEASKAMADAAKGASAAAAASAKAASEAAAAASRASSEAAKYASQASSKAAEEARRAAEKAAEVARDAAKQATDAVKDVSIEAMRLQNQSLNSVLNFLAEDNDDDREVAAKQLMFLGESLSEASETNAFALSEAFKSTTGGLISETNRTLLIGIAVMAGVVIFSVQRGR